MVAASPPRRQAAVAFIFVILVLDTMANGVAMPVMPKLIGRLGYPDPADVATVMAGFTTIFFVVQFFSSTLQGTLSDAYGRRPAILLSTAGMAVSFAILAVGPNIAWLYGGQFVAGLTAGSFAAAFAYLIDVTPEDDRVRMFALAGAASNVGIALGPLLGGVAGTYSLRLPFAIAAGLCLLNCLYGTFVLPESLPAERRRSFSWTAASPFGAIAGVVRDYPAMLKWGAVIVLLNFAMIGVNSVFPVYLTYRYGWGPREIGIYLSVFGLWAMAAQGLVLPVLARRFKERTLVVAGSIVQATFIVLCGLSPFGIGYAGLAVVWLVGVVASSTAINAAISRSVGPSDQGRVQGAARSLTSAVGLGAPMLFASLLSAGIGLGGRALAGLPLHPVGRTDFGGTGDCRAVDAARALSMAALLWRCANAAPTESP